MLGKGRGIVALLGWVALVCLLPTRAGYPEDPPKLLNPFAGDPEAVKEGRRLYMANGCSACHGPTGGGGMGKPILDDTWVFGSDDETLFKLTKGQIPQQTMPKSAGLPDEQREVLILKEFEGLTFPEIAETLDVPLSTVKTRLYRGLVQLRIRLERQGIRGVAAVPVPTA